MYRGMKVFDFFRKKAKAPKGPYDYTINELIKEHGTFTAIVQHYADHQQFDVPGMFDPIVYILWMERLEQVRRKKGS